MTARVALSEPVAAFVRAQGPAADAVCVRLPDPADHDEFEAWASDTTTEPTSPPLTYGRRDLTVENDQ